MPRFVPAILRDHATALLAAGIFLGLLVPSLAAVMRPLLEPSIVVLVTLPLLRLDWSILGGYLRRPGIGVLAATCHVIVTPIILWAVATVLNLSPGLTMALVIWGCAPPILSSATFAQLLRLDAELATVVMVLATLALPLTLPPLALWLADLEVVVSPWQFAGRVGLYLGVPFAVAWGIRSVAGPRRLAAADGAIESINVFMLLVFAVAVMDGVAHRMITEPLIGAAFIAAAFVTNLCFQAGTALAFWRLGRRAALSLGLCAGNRNMGIMWGLAGVAGGADLLLMVALAQVPVYLLPVFARFVYRRLL
jgi:bile acid:Na+ symporter, BASS family